MVIFVLGVCPDVDLEVRRLIWYFLAKVGKLKVWKVWPRVDFVDIGLGF